MNDRIMLYNGIVYLTKRLGKEYPENFYDMSMKELKEIVEGLEQELVEKKGDVINDKQNKNGTPS